MNDFVLAQTQFISQEMLNALNETLFLMPNWKWLALAVAVFLYILLKPTFQFFFRAFKKIMLKREVTRLSYFAEFLKQPIEVPLAWILATLLFMEGVRAVAVVPGLERYLLGFSQIMMAIQIVRFLYLAVDAFGHMFSTMAARTENTLDDQLVPFAAKSMKVVVIVLGVLVTLQNFGLNVMGLLAGLGLGGLALALAAQDTAANLFGSITILFDAPFKIGDFVKLSDVEGTVEEIGFRSTRVRTVTNSLVVIPNSVVAKEKVDNLSARPRRRVRQILGLEYDTTPEKIQQFSDAVRYHLSQEPKIAPDTIVAFNNFNASSLDILLQFHLLEVIDYADETSRTQKVLCEIIQIAKDVGVEFAFPTQTVYMKPTETTAPPSREMRPQA